jgi:hypothetical protein
LTDHSAPCFQYWKIQSTDQLLFYKYQTLLLPAPNDWKLQSTAALFTKILIINIHCK